MYQDLNERVAVVTGATGGIGSAIATELCAQGATVVLVGRDLDRLHILRDKITAQDLAGPLPMCAQINYNDTYAEKDLVSRVIECCGRLDILVNNAGIVDGRLFLKSDEKFADKIMSVNFTIPYNLSREALPYMLQKKYGRIINITSVAGYMGDAGMSAYAASKGALASATKSIATEYGRRGITANCIAPGIVATDAIKKIPVARRAELLRQIPAHRFGAPEEVAYLAAFLASPRAAYINGQQIHINGGLVR